MTKQHYKILGAGTSGVVVTEHRDDENYYRVIKGFRYPTEGFQEQKIMSYIANTVDPHNKFTLKYHGYNGTPPLCREFIIDCLRKEYDTYFTNMVTPICLCYDYGGRSIDDFFNPREMKSPVTFMFEDLLPLWYPILYGVRKLNARNVIHSDIKPGNILFDRTKNKLFLIDFGSACSTEMFPIHILDRSYHPYPYFPPEIILLSYISENERPNLRSLRKRVHTQYIQEYWDICDKHLEAWVGHTASLYHVDDSGSKTKEHFNDVTMYAMVDKESHSVHKKPYSKCFDSFSLGMSLFELYHNAIKYNRIRNGAWCVENVLPIILGLCHPVVRQRTQINEAVWAWSKMIRTYNTLNCHS